MRFPDFLIIGAMKSATSTLHEQLSAQSGIFMSHPKELDFFSDDDVWARGLDWYSSHFEGARATDLCGESSTHYSKLPTFPATVGRLAETIDAPRFIYVMRHPVDRLISHYQHMKLQGETSVSFVSAIGGAIPELVEYGLYSKQLLPYLKEFGPESVLPVFFDRLTGQPQAELERICAFLGYAGDPVWDNASHHNETSERLAVSSTRQRLKAAPLYGLVRRITPEPVVDKMRNRWRSGPKPVLSSRALAELTTTFDSDLQLLGSWLDIPLNCDSFRQVTMTPDPGWVSNLQAHLAESAPRNLITP